MSKSVLIIGAAGRLGQEIIRASDEFVSSRSVSPSVHCLVRTPSKLPPSLTKLCTSVIQGDALSEDDVRRALLKSGADTVIVSIGKGDNVGQTTIRRDSANVLAKLVKSGSEFEHVRVVCISSEGAGGTKIRIGMGLGKVVKFYLRHILEDHNFQEEAFKKAIPNDESQRRRLLIVHPTGLANGKGKGNPVVYGIGERGPSSQIDRSDVASWLVKEITDGGSYFGTSISITGRK